MTKTREAKKTVQCVDTYSELYKDIFPEVRSYESFKYIIVGILSDIKRKSLPAIASSLGLKNEQGLLHFMTDSPWELKELEKRRLNIILEVLEGREIIVIIDETGDPKKRENNRLCKKTIYWKFRKNRKRYSVSKCLCLLRWGNVSSRIKSI